MRLRGKDGESKVTVWQDGIGGASVVTCWYGFIERGERASRDRGAGGDGQRAVGRKHDKADIGQLQRRCWPQKPQKGLKNRRVVMRNERVILSLFSRPQRPSLWKGLA